MSTSGISSLVSGYPSYQTNGQSNRQQLQQDFQSLASALKSNDLSGAQTAFAALQKDLPQLAGGQQNGQTTNSKNPLAADFQSLSQALQSGDLASAQAAYAKLQQDFQTARSGGHHHHHGKSGSAPSTAASASSSVDSDGDHDGSGQPTLDIQA